MDYTIASHSHHIASGWVAALMVLAIWELFWKGLALWSSARNGHKFWYVIMLIVNTAGILEIVYLWWFAKKTKR
jgi:uncharacterized protein DUF5652